MVSNPTSQSQKSLQLATFAGGCFWCMEPVFRIQKGVRDAVVGYSGGSVEHPTYDQVCTGKTGHREAIQITFDPALTPYETLLDIFWRNIDPTDPGGQFADRGDQYRTTVYFHDENQRKKAEASRDALDRTGRFDSPIATQIIPYKNFFPAEEEHQRYYQKRPVHYNLYHEGSGRDAFLAKTWNRKL